MKIKLKEIYILEENINENEIAFKKLIDNSYNEWNEKWKKQSFEQEEIEWKATFEIEYEGETFDFVVDTQGEYLSYLDLEGYMGGEGLLLADETYLKIASKSSGIIVALYFSEAIKYGLLNEATEKALYYNIFPEWSRGLIPEGIENLESVKEFITLFKPYFEKKEILKKLEIDYSSYEILGGNEFLVNLFKEFMEEYFKEELFFFIHDNDYIGSMKDCEEATSDFKINTDILEEYE